MRFGQFDTTQWSMRELQTVRIYRFGQRQHSWRVVQSAVHPLGGHTNSQRRLGDRVELRFRRDVRLGQVHVHVFEQPTRRPLSDVQRHDPSQCDLMRGARQPVRAQIVRVQFNQQQHRRVYVVREHREHSTKQPIERSQSILGRECTVAHLSGHVRNLQIGLRCDGHFDHGHGTISKSQAGQSVQIVRFELLRGQVQPTRRPVELRTGGHI